MNQIKPILQAIRAQYALAWDGLHGITHWARVYENGLLVAEHTLVGQDLILLFAVFHDACRRNDGLDPDHGRRGADLAAMMRGRHFDLPDDQFELLYRACAQHTDGLVLGDPELQTCWDADRLDLSRAGITPTPQLLCTTAAKDPGVISWASARSLRDHVPELLGTEWGQELLR